MPKRLKNKAKQIFENLKDKIIERSENGFINTDSNLSVIVGKRGYEDTISHINMKHKRGEEVSASINALYHVREFIEKGILLDKNIGEQGKTKSSNVMFMQHIYSPFMYAGKAYIANIAVEESYISDREQPDIITGQKNNFYNLKDIKIEPIEYSSLYLESTSSDISIAQLRSLVKSLDENFYENLSAVGRPEKIAEINQNREFSKNVKEIFTLPIISGEQMSLLDNFVPIAEEIEKNIPQEKKNKPDFAGQQAEKIRKFENQTLSEKSFVPQTNAEKLYAQFTEMYPDLVNGTNEYMRYGKEGDTFEPLTVEHFGGNRYGFMTWYVQNGDLMRDPDFTFELDNENKALNIEEYQQDGVYPIGTVYHDLKNDIVNSREVNPVTTKKIRKDLEQVFLDVLQNAREANRPLTKIKFIDGETHRAVDKEFDTNSTQIDKEVSQPVPTFASVDEKIKQTEQRLRIEKAVDVDNALNKLCDKYGVTSENCNNGAIKKIIGDLIADKNQTYYAELERQIKTPLFGNSTTGFSKREIHNAFADFVSTQAQLGRGEITETGANSKLFELLTFDKNAENKAVNDTQTTPIVSQELFPDLRQTLNDFSAKHGLGELNIEFVTEEKARQKRWNVYDNRGYILTEKMADGTKVDFNRQLRTPKGDDMPFTPDTLKEQLDRLETVGIFSGMTIGEKSNRETKVNALGITALPPILDKLPEITYSAYPREKFASNLQALKSLQTLEKGVNEHGKKVDGDTNFKDALLENLSGYSGWGGLPQVFDERLPQWKTRREQLQDVLTPDEYQRAKASTLSSFYTSQVIIDNIYTALKNMNLPENARILEPSCGTGNFFRRLPAGLKNAELTGVELDSVTARIAKYLNPNAKIIESGFEKANLENNSFDVAIGNVPFGNFTVSDPEHPEKDWLIHNAFFRKALDKVAPGGVIAFVTSSGTLDSKGHTAVREYLAEQSELIGAIRLPNNAFSEAGTKVTSDIIFLQKRATPLAPSAPKPDWCYVTPNPQGLPINAYFNQNPQMLLGTMQKTTHFDQLTCVPKKDQNGQNIPLNQLLPTAINRLNAQINIKRQEKVVKKQEGIIEADGSIKNFSFGMGDGENPDTKGKIYYRTGQNMTEVTANIPQITALCKLRDVVRELIDKQASTMTDEELMPLRKQLNAEYDIYRAKYGVINSDKTAKIFSNDIDFPLIRALENHNRLALTEAEKYTKTDIFTTRTVLPTTEITHVDDISEAIQLSLDKYAGVNVRYMSELLEKTPDETVKELLDKQLAFYDPERPRYSPYSALVEATEYLSGDVREKFNFAKMAANDLNDPLRETFAENASAIEKILPKDIPYTQIEVRMGANWVEQSDYTEFLRSLSGRKTWEKKGDVAFHPETGVFEIKNAKSKKDLNYNEQTVYGTEKHSIYDIAERMLNQTSLRIEKTIDNPDPNAKSATKRVLDVEETRKVSEKSKIIAEKFKEWIFANPERQKKYTRIYNDNFNCFVGRKYDGSKIKLNGITSVINGKPFDLHPHQKNAIARATLGGNTLLAHCVGAGKSFEMYATIMKKKELGLINKACLVVPNNIIDQAPAEFQRLYPNAKLLVVTPSDLADEKSRNLFASRCMTGNYDCVIVAESQFGKLAMSKQVQIAFIRNQLDELEDCLKREIEISGYSGGKDRPLSVKQIENAKKRCEKRLEEILNPQLTIKGTKKSTAKDGFVDFEKLGFDLLVADEAHLYKNGFIITKMQNVAGISNSDSNRASDMLMKCDYFNSTFGQGHILFATGTPISNSMTELYVMTRYLRPDLLTKLGVKNFDDWAATFGNVTTKLEQVAQDKLVLRTRFSQFQNLPELMAMYKEFADILSSEKLKQSGSVLRPALKPDENGNKIHIITVPASPEQTMAMSNLRDRAQRIADGGVDSHEDNMLVITNDSRQIALGGGALVALLKKRGQITPENADNIKEALARKDSKMDRLVSEVVNIYNDTTKATDKTVAKGVQIIFSDIAVNSANGNFSAYEYIKAELIAKGISEKEIVFAPKSDAKNRDEVCDKINTGEYRVVIASTSTMGTGSNIQNKLVALHHLDVPWKPSDIEQREGRILRQGNSNKEVQIFNYVTENTGDSFCYSNVTTKARFIAQMLDNNDPSRVCEDCDEKVLTYAEISALANGNPDFKERIELQAELAELKRVKMDFDYEIADMQRKVEMLPERIQTAKSTLEVMLADKTIAESIGDKLQIVSGGNVHSGDTLNEWLSEFIQKAKQNFASNSEPTIQIGTIGKFTLTVSAENKEIRNPFDDPIDVRFTITGGKSYSCEAGQGSNSNNKTRLENLLTNMLPKQIENQANLITRLKTQLEQATERVHSPFSRTDDIAKIEARLVELDEKLSEVDKSALSEDDILMESDGPLTAKQIAELDDLDAEQTEKYTKALAEVDDDDETPTPPKNKSKGGRK